MSRCPPPPAGVTSPVGAAFTSVPGAGVTGLLLDSVFRDMPGPWALLVHQPLLPSPARFPPPPSPIHGSRRVWALRALRAQHLAVSWGSWGFLGAAPPAMGGHAVPGHLGEAWGCSTTSRGGRCSTGAAGGAWGQHRRLWGEMLSWGSWGSLGATPPAMGEMLSWGSWGKPGGQYRQLWRDLLSWSTWGAWGQHRQPWGEMLS